MNLHRLFALVLCICPVSIFAAPAEFPYADSSGLVPGDLLHSVARYLSSRVDVSGRSTRTGDRASNDLGLVSDDLVWSEHRLGLTYQDQLSRRDSRESSSWALNYGFHVAKVDLDIAMHNRESAGVKDGEEGRIESQSERRTLTVSGRRNLYSRRGIALTSLFSHSSGDSRVADDMGGEEHSQYQISKFGVELAKQQQWPFGVWSSANLRAIGGVDSRQTLDEQGRDATRDRFQKLSVAAELNTEIRNWRFGLDGRYQVAPDSLPPSERLQLAGPGLSQGFHGQTRSAYEGGWLRVQADSPQVPVPVFFGAQSYLQLSLLRSYTPGTDADSRTGGGASVGEVSLQLDAEDFMASMSVGKMLTVSDPAMTRISRPSLSLSVLLSL